MAADSRFRVPDLVFFLLLLTVANPFVQKNVTVCHSALDCGRARLTCGPGQRLAILGIARAYHVNASAFAPCPASVQNCSATANDVCCRPPAPGGSVCEEQYGGQVVAEALNNCSAQRSASGPEGGVICTLLLPPLPQPATGPCEGSAQFHSLSSYSQVDYACIDDLDAGQFCQASQRSGTLLYALWTPEESGLNLNDDRVTSCRCSVTAYAGAQTGVFVWALDVRIPQSDVPGECSHVTITDSDQTRLNRSCVDKTTVLFDTQPWVTRSRPPVHVILSLHPKTVPAAVWIGFRGLEGQGLTLTCFKAGENLSIAAENSGEKMSNGAESSPPPAAVIGGTVAAVVFLVIVGFACFHCISKRKRSFKRQEPPSWWDRIRREHRSDASSQPGHGGHHANGGRPMAYGRYRRTKRPSDVNVPIYFVPGNAAPPPRQNSRASFTEEGPEVTNDRRRSSSWDRPPGMPGNAAPRRPSRPAEAGNGVGSARRESSGGEDARGYVLDCTSSQQISLPGVHYMRSGADGKEPHSVVVVNDGNKLHLYDVPPLKITELED